MHVIYKTSNRKSIFSVEAFFWLDVEGYSECPFSQLKKILSFYGGAIRKYL